MSRRRIPVSVRPIRGWSAGVAVAAAAVLAVASVLWAVSGRSARVPFDWLGLRQTDARPGPSGQDGSMVSNFSGGHLLIILAVVAVMVLFVVAIVSIARADRASGVERALWILIVLLFPLLGPILWFAVGRPRVGSWSGSGSGA
ncbi:PLD nuclease N-terminal domain-containing protein [Herbiconiux sp. A18JL235]|uniref:PLD nuclease N-terminal domain-containing protein n=1 Tax=Herbiconiux sp. A18JL235 TaxID=3152363 RepID=A0AB39BCL7_9MICO